MTGGGSRRTEPFWDAQLAIVGVIALYATLPEAFRLGPRWLVPVLGVGLLGALVRETPYRSDGPPEHSPGRRTIATALAAGLGAVNAGALVVLVERLVGGLGDVSGKTVLATAGAIWLSAMLIFAVSYWELDRGGPIARARPGEGPPEEADFFFQQMDDGVPAPADWTPGFVDYLYLSFTNQTAFSPTDVLPLTHKAKLVMLAQSLASFVTVALVAARAVNILG